MPTTTITAQYVNDPKPGYKNASIKDMEGVYYYFDQSKITPPQKGSTFEVTWEAGTKNPNMRFISRIGGSGAQPAKRSHVEAAKNFVASATASNRTNDRFIFITGIVGRAMGSGKFDVADISTLAREADRAFAALIEPAKEKHPLDDETPFDQ